MLKQLGKYEILEQIGKGSMGMVYKAKDQNIGRIVAVKTIKLPDSSDREKKELTKRFKQEAMAAGNLNHPNIVIIYEYDEVDDIAFIAMGYVEGVELKTFFDNNEVFPEERIIVIMQQLLSALEYSHQHGVIHRDIKPSNIMITPTGQVMVTDFGIARLESSDLTQVGITLGTPSYMSPEQCTGQPIDARSDLFSAGVLLYQLLTGEKPFTGPSITSILHKITQIAPPAPSQLNYSISSEFDAILDRSLAKRPSDRFSSAAEFSEALSLIKTGSTLNTGSHQFKTGTFATNGHTLGSEDDTAIPPAHTSQGRAKLPDSQMRQDHPPNKSQQEATIVLGASDTGSYEAREEEADDATVAVPLSGIDAYITKDNKDDDSTVVVSASDTNSNLPQNQENKPAAETPAKKPAMGKDQLSFNISLPKNKYLFIGIGVLVLGAFAFLFLPDKTPAPLESPRYNSPQTVVTQKPKPAKANTPSPKEEPQPKQKPTSVAAKISSPTPTAKSKPKPVVSKVTSPPPTPKPEPEPKPAAASVPVQPEVSPPEEETDTAQDITHGVLYTYAISSTPPGAAVEHRQMGTLDSTTPGETFLKPGEHQFYISKDGFQDISIMVYIDKNSSRQLEVSLIPLQ